LRFENQVVTWQNICYHCAKWFTDESSVKLFEGLTVVISDRLTLECLQLDESHTPSKKGGKTLNGKDVKELKR
jgi:hypothetical protein